MRHYLDNAATTPVAPEVAEIIYQTLKEHYANPSSLYAPGMEAENVIEHARKTLSFALGCTPAEVVFTGSGTEASNLAIQGLARPRKAWGKHLVATGYEHPCVTNPLKMLAEQEGFSLTFVPPKADGTVEEQDILNAVQQDTALVCLMHVNNETGATLNVASLAKRIKQAARRTAVHVDGVQGFTKLPLALKDTLIDSYGVSAHKLYGPKGIGALYLRKGVHFCSPLQGGGQEHGLRPGTENTPYIAGFGKAVELALHSMGETAKTISALRALLLCGLNEIPGITLNSPQNGFAGIVNFSLPGVLSENMLHHLEKQGVYVSGGSACSKGSASHTLSAMKLPAQRIECALRVSFGRHNTPEDIAALLEGIKSGLAGLARPLH